MLVVSERVPKKLSRYRDDFEKHCVSFHCALLYISYVTSMNDYK